MDYSPYPRPWRQPQPNYVAGKGEIDRPGEVANIVWQTCQPSKPSSRASRSDA